MSNLDNICNEEEDNPNCILELNTKYCDNIRPIKKQILDYNKSKEYISHFDIKTANEYLIFYKKYKELLPLYSKDALRTKFSYPK